MREKQKIKNLPNKFCEGSKNAPCGQILAHLDILVKRNKIFSDIFIFPIVSLINRAIYRELLRAIKWEPLGVERWLSPF